MIDSCFSGWLLFVMTGASHANPFLFEYNDTILFTNIVKTNVGDAVKITLALDNGGNSLNSQTWASTYLHSVAFDFGHGRT